MNKPSEDKATPVKGDQNKAKITKDELNEQELDKASGESFSFGAKLPWGPKVAYDTIDGQAVFLRRDKEALDFVRPPSWRPPSFQTKRCRYWRHETDLR